MADPYGGRPSVPHLQPPEDDAVSTFLYHSLCHHNNDSINKNNNDNNSHSNPNAIHNPNHHAPPLLFPVDVTSSSGLFPNDVVVAGSGPSSKQPEASSSFNFSDPGSYYFRSDADKINSGGDFSFVESDVIPDRRENFCDEEKAPGSSDTPSPVVVPRTSSKRCRAAEVHNLSEKRRRSKINEKMKALQKLIPNSDKTDKASMLDEAIEYLKQLQLQVQMLTMRNGLNLHPLYLPGVYQPLHVPQGESSIGDDNKLLDANVLSSTFSMNQETSMRSAFDISNQCTPSDLPVAPTVTNITNAETPYSYIPVFPAHYGPLNLSTSSKEICRENLPRFQVNKSDVRSSPGISS